MTSPQPVLNARSNPAWRQRHKPFARALTCLAGAALLSACANTHTPATSQLTATQEAQTYKARAKPSYAPPGPPEDPWRPYIVEAAQKYDVPERWIREVMRVESNGEQFRPSGVLTTSPVGAMGLMQLMPETYDEVRARYSLGDDAFDPHNNIMAGTAYLREMYDAFGSPGMLAAYNGGPARLEDYLVHNRPLPDETRRYVALIAPYIQGSWPTARSPAEQYAVNRLPIDIPAGPRWVVHRTLVASRGHGRHGHETVRYASAVRVIQVGHHGRAGVEVAEAPEPRHGTHYAAAAPAAHHGFHLIDSAMASEAVRPTYSKQAHQSAGHARITHVSLARPHASAHESCRHRRSCA